jgi:hypothetical protein
MRDAAQEQHGTSEIVVVRRDLARLHIKRGDEREAGDELLVAEGLEEAFDGVDCAEPEVRFVALGGRCFVVEFVEADAVDYETEGEEEGD